MSNNIIEYNTASMVCGGENIIEAFVSSESVRFNESYVIIGECLEAVDIYAMYDLTIMGDVHADKINVNGKLFVAGNIIVDEIQCTNGVTCCGKIQCKKLSSDTDVIANMINADEIDVYGNVLASSSINVDSGCNVERNILAGEGVSGTGKLKADNVMAIDYFDFDGTTSGRIFEMETMYKKLFEKKVISEVEQIDTVTGNSIEEKLKAFYESSIEELVKDEEDEILEKLNSCAEIQEESFSELAFLFNEIIRISYLDQIGNLMDYLLVTYAKDVFPESLLKYETIEHVFSKLWEEAEVDELDFAANNVYEFMIALKIIDKCFPYDDDIADNVFSFIGIRYKTVKKQFEGAIE